MNASHPIPHDVARLICGNVDDLKSGLNGCTDTALLERALAEARQLREGRTKVLMIERAMRRLKKQAPAPAAVVHEGYYGPCKGTPLDQAAIANLRNGTEVEVVWKSGNGPHAYVVRNDLTDAELAKSNDGVRTEYLLAGARFVALAVAPSSPPPLRFTEKDSERANDLWKATCGPHSIAAACGKTLEEVHLAICAADINYRGWMSPTQVMKTLDALGQKYTLTHKLKTPDLCDGINRLQWEGRWLNPGVPARIAYFHTHLVAHFGGWVLCTACLPATWIAVDEWRDFLRKTDQPFHITHHWSVVPMQADGCAL